MNGSSAKMTENKRTQDTHEDVGHGDGGERRKEGVMVWKTRAALLWWGRKLPITVISTKIAIR